MRVPTTFDVLDQHNGFTAITLRRTYIAERVGPNKIYLDEDNTQVGTFLRWVRVMREGNTLWRPGAVLRKGTIGTLVETRKHSFYQTNNNVTKAIYKVPGYRYRVAVWFDNVTGRRLA
jgi:hypothetical protein